MSLIIHRRGTSRAKFCQLRFCLRCRRRFLAHHTPFVSSASARATRAEEEMERAVPLEGNKWLFLLFKFPVCRIVYGILPCHPHTISLALSQASLPHRLHSIDNKQSFHGEGDSRENSFRIPFSGSPLTTSRIELEISSDLNGNATHKGISGLVGGTISLLIVSRAAFIHISSVVLRKQHRKVGTRRTSRGRCERRNKS